MEYCTAVVSARKGKGHDDSLLGQCQEITLPARAGTVRTITRCFTVQRADEGEKSKPDKMLRPVLENDAATEPSLIEGDEPDEETVVVRVLVARAAGLPQADFLGTADPYVEIRLVSGNPLDANEFKPAEVKKHRSKIVDSKTIFKAKTQVLRGTLSPKWEETFSFEVPKCDAAAELFLYFRIYDYDVIRSDDFLGHLSIGLLDALVSSKEISAGWRALLRQSSATSDRLDVLRDDRLPTRAPSAYRILPVPGQEKTYDLNAAELFIVADIPGRPTSPSLRRLGKPGGLQRPSFMQLENSGTLDSANLISNEIELDLFRAAIGGLVPLVWRLVGRGARVNASATTGQFCGCAPLHIACLKGHSDLAMMLVDVFDASLVLPASEGRSAAMCACQAGNETLAEWLIIEGVPADLRDDAGRTVLFYAASAALPQLTSWLMGKQNLSPGFRATDGSTALSAAVTGKTAKSVVVAQQLLEANASVNKADKAGRVPLHDACLAGNDKCVRFLLSYAHAKTDAVDGQGRTAYDFAKEVGLPEATLSTLLVTGRDHVEFDKQQQGETAAEYEKRELRARKAEISDSNWRTWRQMHPRREYWTDNGAGVGDLLSPTAQDIDSEHDLYATSGRSRTEGAIPAFIGRSQPSAGRGQVSGRISRMKAWATGLPTSLRRRSHSPTGAARELPSPMRREDSWSSFGSEARF